MPTYEFKCAKCGWNVDIMLSMNSVNTLPPPACEKCGEEMCRVFLVGGVAFKGDGFYSSRRKRALKKELDRRTEEKQK